MNLATTNIDLLDLIGRDVVLKRAGATDGGEYAGACPWCGGNDRFHVWPLAARPHYWCRQCERHGDAIQYIRDRHGLSFAEARAQLDVAHAPNRPLPRPITPNAVPDDRPPSPQWQETARAFIGYAERELWSASGERARAYLHERRGLTDETIRRWRLGFNPSDLYADPGRWGLEGKKIWLPGGIVIPCVIDDDVWCIKVRRALPPNDAGKADDLAGYIDPVTNLTTQKYAQPRGGRLALFGADSLVDHNVAVLAEGEFDAMLLDQAAGDLVGVATLGSAAARLTHRWMWALLHCRRIFAAYDLDSAGETGATSLVTMSARVRVVKPLGGKDLTAMCQVGGDLRAWVEYQIEKHATVPAPSSSSAATWNNAAADALIDATFRAVAEAYRRDPTCTDPGSPSWLAVEEAISTACSAEDGTSLRAACARARLMVSSGDARAVNRSVSPAEPPESIWQQTSLLQLGVAS